MKRKVIYLLFLVCFLVWLQIGCDGKDSNCSCGIDGSSDIHTKTVKSEKTLKNTLTTEAKVKKTPVEVKLPRLVDLGRGSCIPCKMMTPILEELKAEYKGKAIIDYIDVGKNPVEAKKYGIRVIPTQILYDSTGKEVFRHEGFIPKKDLVTKFESLGVK